MQSRYYNPELGRFINADAFAATGQGLLGNNFQYGLHDASWNACETIAVHNANILLGRESTLSETMRAFQNAGAMIGDGYVYPIDINNYDGRYICGYYLGVCL